MRISLIAALLLCLVYALPSCKKDAVVSDPLSLHGNWEMRESSGDFVGHITYPAGNGQISTFDDTGYAIYRHGQLMKRGHYQVINDSVYTAQTCATVPAPDTKPNRIIYDGNLQGQKIFFEVQPGKLKLSVGCNSLDGGWAVYARVKTVQ